MLTLMDWFCGAGGSSQGAHAVPGVTVTRAANHWERAIESHAANFPAADHYQGDIRTAPVEKWPVCDLFWASPECPQWSNARGKRRDFASTLQGELFGPGRDEEADRSRALMEEVPMYLRGVQNRGGLVLAGVVENVVDVRAWDQWDRWLGEIRALGYSTRVIAMNSMHADPVAALRAPQSRDRLYVAYWHASLGRTPDWDKWLRPRAWCPDCEEWIAAVQVFKTPGADMGRYRQQYVYRCPRSTCRNRVLEPEALPAAAAIDWTIPGTRIGDRAKPLAPKTLARIQAGLAKYARPLMVPAGGTWRDNAAPVTDPMPARTTRENDGVAIPSAWTPFVAELRGGGSVARPVSEALATVTASGNHHGLVTPPAAAMVMRNNTPRGNASQMSTPVTEPIRTLTAAGHQSLITWEHLLVPYYGNGYARSVAEPIGTLSTRDRYALVCGEVDIDDVRFRMLAPHEIGRAMSFAGDYTVLGTKQEKVRQYGNAVTPPVAEVIVSALVEAIIGADLERTRDAEPTLWTPPAGADDGTRGDCATGKCHGTTPDDCGCARHDASTPEATP